MRNSVVFPRKLGHRSWVSYLTSSICFQYYWAIKFVLIKGAHFHFPLRNPRVISQPINSISFLTKVRGSFGNGGQVRHLIDYLLVIFTATLLSLLLTVAHPLSRNFFLSPAFRFRKKQRYHSLAKITLVLQTAPERAIFKTYAQKQDT